MPLTVCWIFAVAAYTISTRCAGLPLSHRIRRSSAFCWLTNLSGGVGAVEIGFHCLKPIGAATQNLPILSPCQLLDRSTRQILGVGSGQYYYLGWQRVPLASLHALTVRLLRGDSPSGVNHCEIVTFLIRLSFPLKLFRLQFEIAHLRSDCD